MRGRSTGHAARGGDFVSSAARLGRDAPERFVDEQKAHVSRLTKNVIFVSKPSLESMRERASKATGRVAHSISLVCGDGVHPNDVGYDAWARHIAEECAPTLRRALASQGGGE